MRKIDTICLIDDDMIFQYLAQKVINETKMVNEIDVFSNGLDAIKSLQTACHNNRKLPDLILLDLFMPIMDGWRFLEEYLPLHSKLEKKIPIYIVSSSIDPADIQKSKKISTVTDFIVKPMKREDFIQILSTHSEKLVD